MPSCTAVFHLAGLTEWVRIYVGVRQLNTRDIWRWSIGPNSLRLHRGFILGCQAPQVDQHAEGMKVSFVEKLKAAKTDALALSAHPWRLPLERVRGKVEF